MLNVPLLASQVLVRVPPIVVPVRVPVNALPSGAAMENVI
jgi:hypothetical protein